jgi:hypothetical protein
MPPALIGHIFVDALVRESLSAPKALTTHPIEDGSHLASHMADQGPPTLTLDVAFGDDEDTYYGDDDAAVKAANKLNSKADKRDAVRKLKNDHVMLDITTSEDFYSGYALTDIIEERTARNSRIWDATLIFQQVRTAKSRTVQVPLETIRKKNNANKTKAAMQNAKTEDGGEVSTKDPDPSSESTLHALISGIVG